MSGMLCTTRASVMSWLMTFKQFFWLAQANTRVLSSRPWNSHVFLRPEQTRCRLNWLVWFGVIDFNEMTMPWYLCAYFQMWKAANVSIEIKTSFIFYSFQVYRMRIFGINGYFYVCMHEIHFIYPSFFLNSTGLSLSYFLWAFSTHWSPTVAYADRRSDSISQLMFYS